MGESEDKKQSGIPAGENAPQTNSNDAKPEDSNNNTATTLEQARKFLQDAQVQNESQERKAEFLKSKGISQLDIERLLAQDESSVASLQPQDQDKETETAQHVETLPKPKAPNEPEVREAEKKGDHPPIITYPEFLTKPARPPPLVTVNGFLNTVYAFAGLSTLVYGTSKYALEPMVESLTEARLSFHETAKENLAKLVGKLEGAVSEIPAPAAKKADVSSSSSAHHGSDGNDHGDGDSGSYEDPTELFHRDVGVQTSLPPSPPPGTSSSPYLPFSSSSSHHRAPGTGDDDDGDDPVQEQTRRIRELAASTRDLCDGLAAQSEGYVDVRRVLDSFGEDLDKLTYPPGDFVGGFSLYGLANKNEPDDEIKRAKENIRRVKGVLLSARSFPASVR